MSVYFYTLNLNLTKKNWDIFFLLNLELLINEMNQK